MQMGSKSISLTEYLVSQMFKHQAFTTELVIIAVVGLIFVAIAIMSGAVTQFNVSDAGENEPAARTFLRVAFGLVWLVDGILQFQPSMPLGLGSAVLAPTAVGTPRWLHALINHSVNLWNLHPLTLAVAVAWFQVGIGLALLVSNGKVGRVVGAVSAGWAAVIWLVGNAAGGIFQSSASVLFGWPGATVWYILAGIFLALRYDVFARRFSLVGLRVVAVIVGIGGLRQLLPSVGFWKGGNANALTAMTQTMTQSAQPHWLAYIVRHGGDLSGSLGGGFNIIIVLWLLVTGVGLWMAPRRQWMWPVWTLVVGAFIMWIIAQDAAVFGGLATDLNSLPPMALVTVAASPMLALRAPWPRRLPRELRANTGSVIVSFALAMLVVAGYSMAAAPLSHPETTFYVAANGNWANVNLPATSFHLTDQNAQTVNFDSSTNQWTIVSFLDPVCYTDCPLIAAQLRGVLLQLPKSDHVQVLAVAANPLHETASEVRTFVINHQLAHLANFHYVTGRLSTLRAIWRTFGIEVYNEPGTVMSVHSDYVFLVSPQHRERVIIADDPSAQSFMQASTEQEIISALHTVGVH